MQTRTAVKSLGHRKLKTRAHSKQLAMTSAVVPALMLEKADNTAVQAKDQKLEPDDIGVKA